jgi:hypothetical protein
MIRDLVDPTFPRYGEPLVSWEHSGARKRKKAGSRRRGHVQTLQHHNITAMEEISDQRSRP